VLPLEEFYTIQGEVFIPEQQQHFFRIGGCDVCHWCDVKESWNALHPPTSVDLVVANASKYAETVVVTGGH
jgi:organic radical activating enzyme